MTNKELQQQIAKESGGVVKGGWLVFENQGSVALNSLTSLPANTKFKNNGYVSLDSLTSLLENTKFENQGYVSLDSLTSLLENTKFENQGGVYLNSLTSLPENTKFENKGYVYLNSLTSLLENTKFENQGYVYLKGVKFDDKSWIHKIVNDTLTAEEVFAIDNVEHRRVAYEFMDKSKMKALKDYKVLDEKVDKKGNPMKILSFTIQNMKTPLKFYNCICPSSKREYFIGTEHDTCEEAKAQCWGFKAEEVEFVNEW